MATDTPTYTAFDGERRLAGGLFNEVVRAVKADEGPRDPTLVRIFDDATGTYLPIDLRYSLDELLRQDPAIWAEERQADRVRGPGRPKLGVVSKEVTLLPRHWAWLKAQRGGASATLRRLVDEARKSGDSAREVRRAQDATYAFMNATVGDDPGYEEALRALYAGDRERFEVESEGWPEDFRAHANRLADPVWSRRADEAIG